MSKLRTHYGNLKVSRDAPDLVIRAAYKSLTQKYHPDKNPGDARAAQVMAAINQSYVVLSNPERRRQHDAWIAREELKLRQQQTTPQSRPIPSQWEKVQPEPSPPQQASRNWLLLPVLLFVGLGLWAAVTPDPAPLSGPKPYQAQTPVAAEVPREGIANCRIVSRLKSGTIFSYEVDGRRHYSSKLPAECDGVASSTESSIDRHSGAAKYTRPAMAPNGSPWPGSTGYVRGYPIDNDGGYSDVTVDNAQNDSDVFVKLVSLDGTTAFPVRQFFIPAGSRFTMHKAAAGKYDIRYRDLKTGGLSRSDAFDVEEERTSDGVRYSDMTMTLYKVQNGNFETYELSESEF